MVPKDGKHFLALVQCFLWILPAGKLSSMGCWYMFVSRRCLFPMNGFPLHRLRLSQNCYVSLRILFPNHSLFYSSFTGVRPTSKSEISPHFVSCPFFFTGVPLIIFFTCLSQLSICLLGIQTR